MAYTSAVRILKPDRMTFMRCLSIQIKPDAVPDFNKAEFLQQVRAIGRSPEIDDFEEKGVRHLHFNFFTELPETLWQEMQEKLYGDDAFGQNLRNLSLVACEGEMHAEDLLLHHFDPTETLDRFPQKPSAASN